MAPENDLSDIHQLPRLIPAGSPRSLHEEAYNLGGFTQFDTNGDAMVFYPDNRDDVIRARTIGVKSANTAPFMADTVSVDFEQIPPPANAGATM